MRVRTANLHRLRALLEQAVERVDKMLADEATGAGDFADPKAVVAELFALLRPPR